MKSARALLIAAILLLVVNLVVMLPTAAAQRNRVETGSGGRRDPATAGHGACVSMNTAQMPGVGLLLFRAFEDGTIQQLTTNGWENRLVLEPAN